MVGRWVVILAGFLLNLMLGIVYAWSVFVKPLTQVFGWSVTVASLPYSIFLLVFAFLMPLAGKAQDRAGPRKVAMLGGALLGVGFLLSGFIEVIRSPYWLVLTYGVIAGAGCGLGYACPIPVARKWFPERPGLATGLVVMGFGLSALLFAPIERMLIKAYGVGSTFHILGAVLLIVAVLAASMLRNPPEGYVSRSPEQKVTVAKSTEAKPEGIARRDLTSSEMVRDVRFYILWLSFFFMALAGLMVIGHIAPYAQEQGIDPLAAAFAVSALSALNALGRPGAGAISDRIGRAKTMFMLFLVQAITLIAFPHVAVSLATLYICAAIIGFNFGANFSLFPTATGDLFGIKHLGANYGLVFTSYGVGGLVGPIMAGYIFDVTGRYDLAFLAAGVLAFIAAFLSLTLRRRR
uniref:MFS transporter n=1 Tax=Fervidicoccus fontis TaxID=683846 RepID=A0A7J3ZK01_9CREN